ncbi:aldo/keto reductase [Sinorhizobium meliloti]|nr:aldo/keto reductase [Sinorhizobium meliloti]WQP17061.1 aldo/keto reductase [Sinorhizobium meliloti]WQP30489.1 aldo/keto reductase [Sinorhizobium meliloti]
MAHSHTPHDCCVRFAVVVTSHAATLATGRSLPLTRTGLAPAGTRQLGLAHPKLIVAPHLMLHWPEINGENARSLRLLQKAFDIGLARNIGVSNYTAPMMREAQSIVEAPLVTNQVEFHPLIDQSRLLDAAEETKIALSSYCSVARGEVFKHPVFAEIGARYGKTAAQTVLRWILQKGVSMNTMSTKPENIRANFEILDFALSPHDMKRIDAMNATNYRILKAGMLPWVPDWDR